MTLPEFAGQWRYLGAFLGVFLEEAGVPLPVPGDVFIAALGAAGASGHAHFLLALPVVSAAVVSGSAVLYEISRRVGEPLLRKYGRHLGFGGKRVERVEAWMHSHGTVAVAFGRLVPGFRIVLTLAAGALRMNRVSFLAGAAAASVLWTTIYYWLGYFLGASVTAAITAAAGRVARNAADAGEYVVVGALVVLAGAATILWRRRRARQEREGGE
jgi:membrane protein DedA with SNARE-associated domain